MHLILDVYITGCMWGNKYLIHDAYDECVYHKMNYVHECKMNKMHNEFDIWCIWCMMQNYSMYMLQCAYEVGHIGCKCIWCIMHLMHAYDACA